MTHKKTLCFVVIVILLVLGCGKKTDPEPQETSDKSIRGPVIESLDSICADMASMNKALAEIQVIIAERGHALVRIEKKGLIRRVAIRRKKPIRVAVRRHKVKHKLHRVRSK